VHHLKIFDLEQNQICFGTRPTNLHEHKNVCVCVCTRSGFR